jgi:hypothetical protein
MLASRVNQFLSEAARGPNDLPAFLCVLLLARGAFVVPG